MTARFQREAKTIARRVDGSEVRNLTNHPSRDQLPAFSPDGKWILFQSDRGGSVDIYRQEIELVDEADE